MRTRIFIPTFGLLCMLLVGCANNDAALLGAVVGRTLGKPLGTVAVAVDETFRTAGDIVKENPRYQRQVHSRQARLVSTEKRLMQDGNPHYYRVEAIVKTNGPADIESVYFNDSKEVTSFWE